ncbi:MAG TPA: alkylphosphonate utilization protein [Acholeplasmataceae bacterium]|jgi:protein PhnA|nr:alkylphosphonate utilization protein [Acholeplasmataceae bacterium]
MKGVDMMICPSCGFEWSYKEDGYNVCSSCQFKWKNDQEEGKVYKDAYGNILEDGDTVMVIKNLKVKGSKDVLKQGTKVTNIRLVDADHDIDCKIPGFGQMSLKSEFVKKV